MEMPKQQNFFSDFSIDFRPHPVNRKIKILKDNDAITQAFKILILTDEYERLYQPNIFTNVRATLFENFLPTTNIILENYIRQAAKNFEPRVDVLNVRIVQNDDKNEINVEITYASKNSFEPVTVNIFLRKIR